MFNALVSNIPPILWQSVYQCPVIKHEKQTVSEKIAVGSILFLWKLNIVESRSV